MRITSFSPLMFYLIVLCLLMLLAAALSYHDLSRAEGHWSWLLAPSLDDAVRVLHNLSRTIVQMTAIMIAATAIAVPISANFYTPKLIDLFITNRVNLAFYSFMALSSLLTHYTLAALRVGTGGRPAFFPLGLYWLTLAAVMVSAGMIVPYLYFVFNFIRPERIVTRMREAADAALQRALKAAGPHERRSLVQRLSQLSEVALKAIDRGDRELAMLVLDQFSGLAQSYQAIKPRLPKAWFSMAQGESYSFPIEAVEQIVLERNWVEFELLRQLELSYSAALPKSKRVLTRAASLARSLGVEAAAIGDTATLRLCAKFFNAFLRTDVNKRDQRAFYETAYQYRHLAAAVLDHEPTIGLEILTRLQDYGRMAANAGLEFCLEVVAYDTAWLVEQTFRKGLALSNEFLYSYIARAEWKNTGYIKATLILLSYFLERGVACEAEAQVISARLAVLDPATPRAAWAEIDAVREPYYWEITDRMLHFDYLPESRRQALDRWINK